MSTANAEGREIGWDEEIAKDAPEFVILPEGDYDFTVESMEKTRHPGSLEAGKLPACNKAVLKIRIQSGDDVAYVFHNLFLHTRTEGMISEFFVGIGQKKRGEPLKPNWAMVPGSTGRAKVGIHEYNGKKRNEIKQFYAKEYSPYQAGKF